MTEAAQGIEQEVSKEVEKPPFDTVLVFGQGPVVDHASRVKASEAAAKEEDADVNFWSKEAAQAAAALFARGQVGEVIVMGGKTGGEQYASEAELIKAAAKDAGIPLDKIKTEARSTNTLENIVNLINQYPEMRDPSKHIAILGADYHMSRIRQLMELFEIPYDGVFSAEAVMRYEAQVGEESDHKKLNELDRRLDVNEASKTPTTLAPGYFPNQAGTEQKDIHRRLGEEDFFSRALLEEPRYWLGYVGGIEDNDLMMKIVGKQDPKVLQEMFAIDPSTDTPDSIRTKLLPFRAEKRVMPPVEEWIGQPYPEDSVGKLVDMVEKRKATSSPAEK